MAHKPIVVGIDVSSEKVDVCIRGVDEGTLTKPNTAEGHIALIVWLRKHGVELAVMEASGGYEGVWAETLRGAGIEVSIVEPKRIRSFARASGELAKTDAIDAHMIAWYGEVFAETLRKQAHDPAREELARVMTARAMLKKIETMILQLREHKQPPAVVKAQEKIAKVLKAEIAKLEKNAAARIQANEAFAARDEIIQSVPGVGPIFSAAVLAWLPELGRIGEKQIAALVGTAPYADDSGERRGQRHIQGGRRKIRDLLYMVGVGVATQNNPELIAHYQRLLARGKEKKVAIVACMRKLLVILNAMLKRGETWRPASALDPAT